MNIIQARCLLAGPTTSRTRCYEVVVLLGWVSSIFHVPQIFQASCFSIDSHQFIRIARRCWLCV